MRIHIADPVVLTDHFGTGSTHATRGPDRSQMPESTGVITSSALALRSALGCLYCSDRVAVTFQGYRGSQHRNRVSAQRHHPGVAVTFQGDRGSQLAPGDGLDGADQVTVVLRGDRGSQPRQGRLRQDRDEVAVVLPGDRGSQRRGGHRDSSPPSCGGRSPGDRGSQLALAAGGSLIGEVAVVLRGGRGSQPRLRRLVVCAGPGRPRIATCHGPAAGSGQPVAVVLRGDRGSQPWCGPGSPGSRSVAVALRGGRASQHHCLGAPLATGEGGGRPSGRPRIATTRAPLYSPPRGHVAVAFQGDRESQPRHGQRAAGDVERWRSPTKATEDRNSGFVGEQAVEVRVAVGLEGDQGSQRLCQWPILWCRLQGGWWFGGQEVRCQSVGCSPIVVVRGRGAGIGSRIICVARLLWPGFSPSVSVLGMWPSTWPWFMTWGRVVVPGRIA